MTDQTINQGVDLKPSQHLRGMAENLQYKELLRALDALEKKRDA